MQRLKLFKRPKVFALTLAIIGLMVSSPVLAAILVQNSVLNQFSVEDSPIEIIPGGDDSSSFLTVTAGTASNDDDDDSIGANTLLASNTIDFTCFAGERTIYSDVIQVANNSTDNWDIGYSLDTSAYNSTFGADAAGDADIYVYVSNADSTTPVATNPISTPADWNSDFLQAELIANTMQSTGDPSTDSISAVTVNSGEQRQISVVVDCGTNLADEAGQPSQGEFTINVEANPI